MNRRSGSMVTTERLASPHRRSLRQERVRVPLLIYALISGAVSVMTGAAVSLAASGSGRLVLWSAVTGALAVTSGAVYESRLLRYWYSALGRWMRQN